MKTAEEILREHRLYICPTSFGEEFPVNKVTYTGALKAMQEYADQFKMEFPSDEEIQEWINENIGSSVHTVSNRLLISLFVEYIKSKLQ